jgi:hypothetical protein
VIRRLLIPAAVLGTACASAGGTPPAHKPNVDPGRVPAPRVHLSTTILHHPAEHARFVFDRQDSVAMRMPNGEDQVQQLGRTVYLTVTAVPSGGEFAIDIAADSVHLDAPASFPRAMIDSAKGTHWTGRLTGTGRLIGLTASRSSLIAQQLAAQLRWLFPILPPGGAQPDSTWSDSTTRRIKLNNIDVSEVATTHYRARAPAPGDPAGALVIEGTRNGVIDSGGPQFGQSIQGTTTESATWRMSADGTLLGAEGTELTDMTLTIQSVGQTVPAMWQTRVTVTPIP